MDVARVCPKAALDSVGCFHLLVCRGTMARSNFESRRWHRDNDTVLPLMEEAGVQTELFMARAAWSGR